MILVDTDVCIKFLKNDAYVQKQFMLNSSDIALSFMTVAELFYGVEKATIKQPEKREALEKLLYIVHIFQSDTNIMKTFGRLKKNLSERNVLVPDADLFIAATALTSCKKLVTGNTKHFERIEGLRLENWIKR